MLLASLGTMLMVILIDIVLSGDNAVVIGMAANGLPANQRTKAIAIGMAAATVLRLAFASVTAYLFHLVGLQLLGGIILAWVCWKMYADLQDGTLDGSEGKPKARSLAQAAWIIILADVSMSLDNVLAVAGAAREHPFILVFGLILSIGLMGLAASAVAKLLDRWKFIAYLGLAMITYVAAMMLYHGAMEVWPYVATYLN